MSNRIPLQNLPAQIYKPDSNPFGKIYTRSFTGLYRNYRRLGAALLFLLYFGTVWLQWNGRQAVLWDLESSKFHVFGYTYWPEDFTLLAILLIIAATGLFFVTVIAGRVWCGYACPQSVWTWVFLWAEKITEGDRNARIKLDEAALSPNKINKRVQKHALWLLISAATALTFVGYFTPIRALIHDISTVNADVISLFWVAFFTAATYINAGWLRERVCMHACPYARFQSAMFDSHTRVIAYDAQRGDPRGSRKKDTDAKVQGLGDCIDCQLCVQVCPTGIDIRNGLQMECIGCAACIDACDNVMDKMHYPKGLIRYASEQILQGKPSPILRPRLLAYAAVLMLFSAGFGWMLVERPLVSLSVVKDRTLYQQDTAGNIINKYQLKILNKDTQARTFSLQLVDSIGLQMTGSQYVHIPAETTATVPLTLSVGSEKPLSKMHDIIFLVTAQDISEIQSKQPSKFFAPGI